MPEKSNVSQLQELNLLLRRQLEQAEAQVPVINDLITQLNSVRLVHETVLLGPVIYQRGYSAATGQQESGQVLQAALLIPGGIGVVLWNSEEYAALREPDRPPEPEAFRHFVPFDDCELAVRGLLLPHVEPLLERLIRQVHPPETLSD